MHKIVKEQESGWWVVYEDVGVSELYLGSYSSKESAIKSHPNAELKPLDS
jgi:hypothetical protein